MPIFLLPTVATVPVLNLPHYLLPYSFQSLKLSSAIKCHCVTLAPSGALISSQAVPNTNAVSGDKRVFFMDEKDESRKKSKTSNKKPCIFGPVPKTLTTSILDVEISTELVNQSGSWCCSSEDDSIGMYEESVGLKQSDRPRGRSWSSKNSQSLYAKKRRERINEKLKILQKLIPNGTKVDISTMLEEAVQYVKFLQLQIKLLSSDETWMYAPLAYDHMSIDLNRNAAAHQS